eukprot:2634612-Pyramimonas_sp.AAC.1
MPPALTTASREATPERAETVAAAPRWSWTSVFQGVLSTTEPSSVEAKNLSKREAADIKSEEGHTAVEYESGSDAHRGNLNSSDKWVGVRGDDSTGSVGTAGDSKERFSLCLGILSMSGIVTLESTLQSYCNHGLLNGACPPSLLACSPPPTFVSLHKRGASCGLCVVHRCTPIKLSACCYACAAVTERIIFFQNYKSGTPLARWQEAIAKWYIAMHPDL